MVKVISKRELQWLLFLSIGILGTIPLIRIFIPSFGISGYFTGVLFSTYIGLVLWGYYIEQYVTVDRTKNFFAVLSFVLFIVFQVVATYHLYQKDSSKYLLLDNRIFITITGSAMAFYVTIKYLFSKFTLGPRVVNAITRLGGLTFGIYLLSDLIIDLTKPVYAMLCAHIHVILAMGLWELLIFSTCAILTVALKQIPGLKKWI